jgi:prephenate dehydrogenase
MTVNKKPLIGIIGGNGKMGRRFKTLFEKRGLRVFVSDKNTPISNKELAGKADIIIVSVPIRETKKVIEEIRSVVKKNALLCDTASLKIASVQEMKKARCAVLGMHPLFGPSISSLRNQTIVFCRVRNNKLVDFLENIFIKEGVKIIKISPKQHDSQMALIQGLVFFVNIALANTLKSQGLSSASRLLTPSFRFQSLAMGKTLGQDSHLFSDIQTENPYFEKVLTDFLKRSGDLAKNIAEKDSEKFMETFKDVSRYFNNFVSLSEKKSCKILEIIEDPKKKTE